MQILAGVTCVYEPNISIIGVHLLLFQLPRQPIILIPLVLQIVRQNLVLHVYFIFDQGLLLDNLVLLLDTCQLIWELFTFDLDSLEFKTHLLKSSLHLFIVDLHGLNSVLIKATLIFHQIVNIILLPVLTKMHLRCHGRLRALLDPLRQYFGRWWAGFWIP